MIEFKWVPPYIHTKVKKVTILPIHSTQEDDMEPTKEMTREHYKNVLDALNLPAGSGVQRTGPLARNDDFALNERHFYNRSRDFHNE